MRAIALPLFVLSVLLSGLAPVTHAALDPKAARELYERVSPSLVVVQYTLEFELGRQELTMVGVVISDDGKVMFTESATPTSFPDAQLKDFKIVIPGDDETEIPAEFQGRDDRSNMSIIKATDSAGRKWTPIKFEDLPIEVGDTVYSIGLLPKDSGYKTYLMSASVAARLRGPTPQLLVSGDGLGNVGAPVLNEQGKAIGIVHYQNGTTPFLATIGGGGRGGRGGRGAGGGGGDYLSITNPPKFFVPARDFMITLTDPPTTGEPLKIPHLGVVQLSGLNKAELEYFDLKGQTAIQVGDVIPNFPAAKAGLKSRDIIVKLNGEPLERGDEPDEAPAIMTRKIQRMKPGQTVTFSVLRKKGAPLTDVSITLEERPRQSNLAKRFYAEDLGFSVRELVFQDTFALRIPADSKGVLVALVKPSSSAQSGKLDTDDMITKLNQTPVENLEQFKTQYEAFRKDHPREAVVLEVLRGVNTEVVRIEPPQ